MIEGLVAGRLYGDAQARIDKMGQTYAVVKVLASGEGVESLFVNVIAFDGRVRAALLELRDGDAVALSGALTPKVWTDKQGNHRSALDLVAQRVLSMRDEAAL